MNTDKRICVLQQIDRFYREKIKTVLIPAAIVFLLLAALFFPGADSRVSAGGDELSMPVAYYNGSALKFDISPLFDEEVPLFPLREIFEEHGFTVTWDAAAGKAVLVAPGRVLCLYPGNPLFSVNGVVRRTTRPPLIVQGRTMVALDFLGQAVDWEELIWEEKEAILHLEGTPAGGGETEPAPPPVEGENDDEGGEGAGDEDEIRKKYDLHFIEVHLFPAGEATVGENLEITVAAPFVEGIYAYAVSFSYDPEQFEVLGFKNIVFDPLEEYAWQKIDNEAGTAEYLQTALGYREKISSRGLLAILEVKALQEGAFSLPGNMLAVTALDNNATPLPMGLEEKTMRVLSSP